MAQVFAEEQPRLLALPDVAFGTEERCEVCAHKTPYVRFDLNDYSIPHTHVGRALTLLADLDAVRILDGQQLIAKHPRSFDRGAQIEQPQHIEALVDYKRAARAQRGQDRLQHAAASAKALFLRAGERGAHLGVLSRGLLELLERHGAAALEAAIAAALAEDAAHLAAVRHFIDRHAHARGQRPPVAVALPEDARVRAVQVREHALADYQQLAQEPSDEHARNDEHQPTEPKPLA